MTVRRIVVCLLVLVGLAQGAPAQAQIVKKALYSIATDFKRNNCWPKTFVVPDRQAARVPFEQMVQSGWQRQNLLGPHHFDEHTGELTDAGKLKVGWIINQLPRQHRVLFVSRAETEEDTAKRLRAVGGVAARLTREGDPPPIYPSSRDAGGWPAGRVDMIGRKFEESTPDPALPQHDSSGGSS
jgi:hypothetical protein